MWKCHTPPARARAERVSNGARPTAREQQHGPHRRRRSCRARPRRAGQPAHRSSATTFRRPHGSRPARSWPSGSVRAGWAASDAAALSRRAGAGVLAVRANVVGAPSSDRRSRRPRGSHRGAKPVTRRSLARRVVSRVRVRVTLLHHAGNPECLHLLVASPSPEQVKFRGYAATMIDGFRCSTSINKLSPERMVSMLREADRGRRPIVAMPARPPWRALRAERRVHQDLPREELPPAAPGRNRS